MTTENQAPEGADTAAPLAQIERLLTNLQPYIVQACYPGRAAFIDNYVDPALEIARAALAAQPHRVSPEQWQLLVEAARTQAVAEERLRAREERLAAAQAPAEGDAVPWSKTVESVSLLLNRATQWPIDDCENFAATIIGMVNAQPQPKGTMPTLPASLIQRISEYGDARADDGDSGQRLGAAIEAVRAWGATLAVPCAAPAPAPAENLPTKEHIRELAQEALDQIMEQAQVFASAWSLVGGRFDYGNALSEAHDAKDELRSMVRSLADLAAETVRPIPCAAVKAEVPVATNIADAFLKCKDEAIKSGAHESYQAVREAFDALQAALVANAAPSAAEALQALDDMLDYSGAFAMSKRRQAEVVRQALCASKPPVQGSDA